MPKVYVISNNGFDFTSAAEKGELVFLTSGYVDVHKDFDKFQEKFQNILKDFKHEEDYLLLVGSNLLCVLAYHCVLGPTPTRILQWHPLQNRYVEYTL